MLGISTKSVINKEIQNSMNTILTSACPSEDDMQKLNVLNHGEYAVKLF